LIPEAQCRVFPFVQTACVPLQIMSSGARSLSQSSFGSEYPSGAKNYLFSKSTVGYIPYAGGNDAADPYSEFLKAQNTTVVNQLIS